VNRSELFFFFLLSFSPSIKEDLQFFHRSFCSKTSQSELNAVLGFQDNAQQDAGEFCLHLLGIIQESEKNLDPLKCLLVQSKTHMTDEDEGVISTEHFTSFHVDL